MLENQNSMDEQLREKFESFEMTPPDSAWDGIKSSLKGTRGMANWIYFVPATLFLAFFITYAYFGDSPFNSNSSSSSSFTDSLGGDVKTNEDNPEVIQNPKVLDDPQLTQLNDIDVIADSDLGAESKVEKSIMSTSANKNSGERTLTTDASYANKGQNKATGGKSENGSSENLGSLATINHASTVAPTSNLSDAEENYFFTNSFSYLTLPKKSLNGYYFVNSANPTKFPFNTINQRNYPSHRFDRFSIEGGVGVSTFRINPIEKDNSDLISLVKKFNSDEFGIGAHFGVNYAFRGNYAVSVGVEVISQRNKLIGKVQGMQTELLLDTIGFDVDTVFQDSITWYLDTTWVMDTTILETSSLLEVNSLNKSTLVLIPFSFSMRKALGVRSALEFNLGGSLGIYQVGSGQVILNNSGQVVSMESAYRRKGQLMLNASVKYLYQMTLKQALYIEPRIGVGVNNFYQSSFNYQSRISQLGVRIGYRMYLQHLIQFLSRAAFTILAVSLEIETNL